MRSLKIWNGISGSPLRWAYCWNRKSTRIATPAPMISMMVTAPQTGPQWCDCPSINPNVIRNRPAVTSTVPSQSRRCRRLSLRLGITIAAPTSATAPTGRLTKKIQRQPKSVTSQPPTTGPAIVATPAVAPQMPNAAPRFSGGKITVSTDSVCGVSNAPPMPCTTRKMISWSGVCAKPHAADASMKITRPMRKSRLGPYRSPSRPAVISRTA